MGGLRTTLVHDMTLDGDESENGCFVGELPNLINGGTYTVKATFTTELSNNKLAEGSGARCLPTRIRLRVVAIAINGKPCRDVWLTGHDAVTLDEQQELLCLRNQLLNKLSDWKHSEFNSPAIQDFADRLK